MPRRRKAESFLNLSTPLAGWTAKTHCSPEYWPTPPRRSERHSNGSCLTTLTDQTVPLTPFGIRHDHAGTESPSASPPIRPVADGWRVGQLWEWLRWIVRVRGGLRRHGHSGRRRSVRIPLLVDARTLRGPLRRRPIRREPGHEWRLRGGFAHAIRRQGSGRTARRRHYSLGPVGTAAADWSGCPPHAVTKHRRGLIDLGCERRIVGGTV